MFAKRLFGCAAAAEPSGLGITPNGRRSQWATPAPFTPFPAAAGNGDDAPINRR